MNLDWSTHLDDATLNEYLDATLAPPGRAEVAAHLEACAGCQQRLAELRALFAALDSLPDAPLEHDLSRKVAAALQPQRLALPLGLRLAFVAQAGLVLLLGLALWPTLSADVTPIPTGPFIGPFISTFADSAQALAAQWQAALEAARVSVGGELESARGWLPAPLGMGWGAGLAAVALLWLVGNSLLLRLIPLHPRRSRT
jgi:anti-sigma factor RsiW